MLTEQDATTLSEFLLGDAEATAFVVSLLTTLHAWDGLIDKDREVSDHEIDLAFFEALVSLPANPFYRRHFAQLHPLLSVAFVNWKTATAMESSGDATMLSIAFIIRSDYCNIVLKCMELLSGLDFALAHAGRVRRFFHSEGFDAYREALLQERAVRGEVKNALRGVFHRGED